ncbi:polysaccharide biosynthesis tyrosine autokinase [Kribbia dieselivorans]|uniref:polysaccharide biosynthesis tyrosine autokinase n=1 Tax=Kribbia dieselivorans TaxID=331526 RepID=UPI00083952B0|nr:polysaccharide biosynthesis tyrosine autokinase [Kribbia dieselivorans]
MELQDYLRIVRKRWHIIIAAVLVMVALAAIYNITATREYAASTKLFVSTTGSSSDQLVQGSTFTQQRVKSYADVITTPKILDPVIRRLDLNTDATKLAKEISTKVPLDTVVIDVEVTDPDPKQAAQIANAVATQFVGTVDELEGTQGATGTSGNSTTHPIKVTVVKEATADPNPVRPQTILNLALGFIIGLVLGLALALLRELLDTSVKTDADVRGLTEEPVIGWIGYDATAPKNPLVMHDPQGPRAENFRALRTNLQFVDAAGEARTIVLTSSTPGEGKTTTTANLALTLGEAGHTVCMVEADLRRPRLLDYLGLDGSVGLTNVLIGEADLDDVLQPFGGTNATVLGAGLIPPNPSELLGSPTMSAIITTLAARYDYVLFDAPPLLPVTDAAVLARQTDGTIVVVGSGKIRKEQLGRALGLLERVNATVLGVVMNMVPMSRHTYSYYGESDERDTERRRNKRARQRV